MTEKVQKPYFRGSDKLINDLSYVLNDSRGRRFLSNLIGETGAHSLSLDIENINTTLMAFNEGRRNVGLLLTSIIINTDKDKYIQMIKEGEV